MSGSAIAASIVANSPTILNGVKGIQCRMTDVMDFFFIAHPESGRKEGEEGERIMYFQSPKPESFEKQTQITGFAEAVVNFTNNFTGDDVERDIEFPYRYVSTMKQLHVYILVESSRFIVGTALNKTLCSNEEYTLHAPTIRSIVITAYKMFRLFFGSFSKLLIADRARLKDRLEYFFSRYLSLLRLNRLPLVDLFCGVDFLPLDSVTYLRVENLLGQLRESFPQISKAMFLYQGRLLSYSVPKQDLAVLFQYLTQNLLNMSMRAELQPDYHAGRPDSISHHHGRFLTGTTDVSAEAMIANAKDTKLPVVYLSADGTTNKLIPYELIVYRALNATLCMFVRKEVDANFLRDLDAMLGPELSSLASVIADAYGIQSKTLSADNDFHFVYFNPSSLSLKTSLLVPTGETIKTTSLPPIPQNICMIACETVDQYLNGEDFGEVSIRSDSDWWIVGKKTNGRILLLMLHNTSLTTLADVQQHVNNIIKQHFNCIFVI
ncbi:Vacuolar fusion protein CCZ1 -like protein [Toxocara canis]|uniref:Vacuolar fusion protein CCZ1-like protein n=1 Tax=Toxocara canis TaxID=6265 RepID=A0A0B2W2S2_TOXCA|nr:Vacuolar fusion protein CCZ1 -like protein [Toxocara canis]